jgi:hypothetical protein
LDPNTERLVHALCYPVVAFLSSLRARKAPAHRVVAGLFWMWTFANTACLLVRGPLDAHTPPYEGGLLLALHVERAAYVAITLGTMGAIAVYFAKVRVRWIVLTWALTAAAFSIWKALTNRPSIEFHERVFFFATLVALVLVARAVLAPADRLVRPDQVHAILALLLCADLVHVTVLSIDGILENWPAARGLDVAVYGVLTVAYVAAFAREWHARSRLNRT